MAVWAVVDVCATGVTGLICAGLPGLGQCTQTKDTKPLGCCRSAHSLHPFAGSVAIVCGVRGGGGRGGARMGVLGWVDIGMVATE